MPRHTLSNPLPANLARMGLLYQVAAALAALAGGTASAQWTVTDLTPHAIGGQPLPAAAWGVGPGGKVVGTVGSGAVLWTDGNSAAVQLGIGGSAAYAISGNQQAGSYDTTPALERHACMWSGTLASRIDLHPAGTTDSTALAIGDGEQGGGTYITGSFSNSHLAASLWHGSAASWVNLHPAAAKDSLVYGVGGGQQVGFVHYLVSGEAHASLWTGSASSWVDLNPPGSVSSAAYAVGDGQQGGSVNFGDIELASLWTGTAESWVNLNPEGSSQSDVYGISHGIQVGFVRLGDHLTGQVHAAVWHGTAESWEDLNAFMPPECDYAVCRAVWSDGVHTYVAGYGHNATTNQGIPLLWTRDITPPPACPGDFNGDHTINTADLATLLGVFGQSVSPGAAGDANGDGIVNTADLAVVLGSFGQNCP